MFNIMILKIFQLLLVFCALVTIPVNRLPDSRAHFRRAIFLEKVTTPLSHVKMFFPPSTFSKHPHVIMFWKIHTIHSILRSICKPTSATWKILEIHKIRKKVFQLSVWPFSCCKTTNMMGSGSHHSTTHSFLQ